MIISFYKNQRRFLFFWTLQAIAVVVFIIYNLDQIFKTTYLNAGQQIGAQDVRLLTAATIAMFLPLFIAQLWAVYLLRLSKQRYWWLIVAGSYVRGAGLAFAGSWYMIKKYLANKSFPIQFASFLILSYVFYLLINFIFVLAALTIAPLAP